ncbi:low specificity L-threonine aldolase [bacterium]|nr:MAG: low specificity L-threonine aldolase [bacterium]
MNFASDNVAGAAPEILAALLAANEGAAAPYGADAISRRLEGRFAEVFEHEVAAFPVATGTAANALSLATITPPYGAILCHAEAHIHTDECGAPEFFTGGAKLLTLPGEHGKLSAQTVERALAVTPFGSQHAVQPAALSLSQVSEAGTVYTPAEISALSAAAHRYGLLVHMDGSRLANALVALGVSPSQATWRSGIDVLSFGATKNGALGAEAVIFFDPARASDLIYRRKRGGHLFSKQRFLSAQLEAYLHDDLWLRNARHANEQAARLAAGLQGIEGVTLRHTVDANILFVNMPEELIQRLTAAGASFHRIGGTDSTLVRLVTAFTTNAGDVDRFVDVARTLSRV